MVHIRGNFCVKVRVQGVWEQCFHRLKRETTSTGYPAPTQNLLIASVKRSQITLHVTAGRPDSSTRGLITVTLFLLVQLGH